MKRPSKKSSIFSRHTPAERSLAQRWFAVLKAGGDARIAKVKRVKQAVRRKCYENELKLSVAIDRMTRELIG